MKCGWPESETKQSLQVCGWAAKPQNQLGWKRPLISSRPALNPALPSTKPRLWEPQLYVLNPSRDGDSSTLLGSCGSLGQPSAPNLAHVGVPSLWVDTAAPWAVDGNTPPSQVQGSLSGSASADELSGDVLTLFIQDRKDKWALLDYQHLQKEMCSLELWQPQWFISGKEVIMQL